VLFPTLAFAVQEAVCEAVDLYYEQAVVQSDYVPSFQVWLCTVELVQQRDMRNKTTRETQACAA
jgi:hypothetical protein